MPILDRLGMNKLFYQSTKLNIFNMQFIVNKAMKWNFFLMQCRYSCGLSIEILFKFYSLSHFFNICFFQNWFSFDNEKKYCINGVTASNGGFAVTLTEFKFKFSIFRVTSTYYNLKSPKMQFETVFERN